VLVVSAGGTISTRMTAAGAEPHFEARALIEAVPEIEQEAEVITQEVMRKSSRGMTPMDMCLLAHAVDAGVQPGCDGVVITHGTDTMEETAYALALQLRLPIPVVLTGAMRPGGMPGADGPANLLAAVRLAATPEAAALGPVVVFQDEIHLARFVTKAHTSLPAAFTSPGFGPVGVIGEGRVHLFAHPLGTDYLGLPDRIDGRVELIWVAAGSDGFLVTATLERSQGIVIAGTGGGHVPPAMVDAIAAALERGVAVVLSSRTGAGPILDGTYGGAGSETHLLSLGVHSAGLLAPLKARLRLLVGLALGRTASDLFPRRIGDHAGVISR
jgi:L-asparaginase